jgi:hypothetical protein
MIVRVQSCLPIRYLDTPLRATAPNVEVVLDSHPGASPFFYTDEDGAVSVARDRTSSFGFGGVFNLPPYNVGVRAIDTISGSEVASGRGLVVEGGIAFVYLLPRSAQ